jgi:hypothetical protein
MQKYPMGMIVNFTEGEYSDFGNVGLVVTLRDCDMATLVAEFLALHEPVTNYGGPGGCAFVAWLVANQHCAPVDCNELHLGNYGNLELDS